MFWIPPPLKKFLDIALNVRSYQNKSSSKIMQRPMQYAHSTQTDDDGLIDRWRRTDAILTKVMLMEGVESCR